MLRRRQQTNLEYFVLARPRANGLRAATSDRLARRTASARWYVPTALSFWLHSKQRCALPAGTLPALAPCRRAPRNSQKADILRVGFLAFATKQSHIARLSFCHDGAMNDQLSNLRWQVLDELAVTELKQNRHATVTRAFRVSGWSRACPTDRRIAVPNGRRRVQQVSGPMPSPSNRRAVRKSSGDAASASSEGGVR